MHSQLANDLHVTLLRYTVTGTHRADVGQMFVCYKGMLNTSVEKPKPSLNLRNRKENFCLC